MREYIKLLQRVLDEGSRRPDRTSTGTISKFGESVSYDMADGFPLLTTKKVFFKAVVHELLWFLKGDTNIKYLNDNGVHIWDDWADEHGDVGPIYGKQWTAWELPDGQTVNQIERLVTSIRENPFSRRHILSGWNVAALPDESISPQANVANGQASLPPCHVIYQWYVTNDGKLDALLFLRSNDLLLGNPFNTASLALLTTMLADQTGLEPGQLTMTIGDAHIYQNHLTQVRDQVSREPRPLPKLNLLRKPDSIFDYTESDFELEGYDPHPAIRAPRAV